MTGIPQLTTGELRAQEDDASDRAVGILSMPPSQLQVRSRCHSEIPIWTPQGTIYIYCVMWHTHIACDKANVRLDLVRFGETWPPEQEDCYGSARSSLIPRS